MTLTINQFFFSEGGGEAGVAGDGEVASFKIYVNTQYDNVGQMYIL